MQHLLLSPVAIPDLVNLIASELETRLQKRETATPSAEPIRLYGDRAAATYLGCSILTVGKLRKSGQVPYYRYGRKFYYIAAELDQALKISQRKFGKKSH